MFGECHFVTSLIFQSCVRGLPASCFLKVAQVHFGKPVARENYAAVELATWPQRAIFSCGL